MRRFLSSLLFVALAASAHAETIKIGMQKLEGLGPVFIAQERNYFTAEGLTAELVYFDSAQPVAVATVSGDIDVGIAGLGAGFYNLAGQGALRIIASYVREAPSFQATAYVISNRAYAAGLRDLKDFPGHSVAISQTGSTQHYDLGLLAEKYGFDLKSLRILPLQSGANEATAIIGGQIDAAVVPSTYVTQAVQQGNARLLGWVGDETPWQLGAVFTATRTANDRPATVERFLRAFRNGVRDFHAAFTGADEHRSDGPTAPAILAILAKYIGEPIEAARAAIPYYDGEARLDRADILHQIAWHRAQNLLKGAIDGDALIDRRYAIDLPKR